MASGLFRVPSCLSQILCLPSLQLYLPVEESDISKTICVLSPSRPWRWVGGQLMPVRGRWPTAEWWTDWMSSGWTATQISSGQHRLMFYLFCPYFFWQFFHLFKYKSQNRVNFKHICTGGHLSLSCFSNIKSNLWICALHGTLFMRNIVIMCFMSLTVFSVFVM